MFKKIKERFSKLKLLDYVLIILIILLSIVFAVIALKDESPNNNEVNGSELSTTNLSTYQNNDIINLASPDLTGKEYLGNGVYRLSVGAGLTFDYNVYTGNIIVNGTSTTSYAGNIFTLTNTLLNGETYTLSRYNNNSFSIYLTPNLQGALIYPDMYNTIVLNSDKSEIFFSDIAIGEKFINYTFQLQIEKGTTATLYQTPIGALEQHIQIQMNNSYWEGYDVGYDSGRDTGINEGYDSGYDWGFYSGFNEGFDEGHDQGYIMGTNEGLDNAYDKGFDEGERVGKLEGFQEGKELYGYHLEGVYYTGRQAYNLGFDNSPSNNFGSLITSILLGVGSVLGIELLPNITIGAIIAVPIVFGIIAFVLGRKKE